MSQCAIIDMGLVCSHFRAGCCMRAKMELAAPLPLPLPRLLRHQLRLHRRLLLLLL